jgi:hypothetical protein
MPKAKIGKGENQLYMLICWLTLGVAYIARVVLTQAIVKANAIIEGNK